jgi:hypothetical protein
VGIATLRVELSSEKPEDWLDFKHHGRFARGRRAGYRLRGRRTEFDPGTKQKKAQPYFPDPDGILAGTEGGRLVLDSGEGVLYHLLAVVLHAAGFGAEERVPTREVFVKDRMLPYTVLVVDREPSPGAPLPGDDPEVVKLLYRFRRMFHARQTYHPSAHSLRLEPPGALEYACGHWFLFAVEGGGYVSVDPPDEYFRHQMPDRLADQYFLLFLLTLHQRFALMALSDQVARHWPGARLDECLQEGRNVFEAIRTSLFAFTARGYFTQVMQRENHHRCYVQWQQTFQIDRLYREVRTEVREMHEYLQDRQERQRTRRVEVTTWVLTVLIGIPALILGFMGINVRGWTVPEGLHWAEAVAWAAGVPLVVALLILVVWPRLPFRRRD